MKKIFATLVFFLSMHGHAAVLGIDQVRQASLSAQDSLETLEREANQGDAMAQVRLGYRYLEPVMISLNLETLATAQQSMQTLNASGTYTEALQKGLYWTLKSAATGLAVAQRLAGLCHLVGIGAKVNLDTGWGWIQKAAEHGDPEAQYLLGLAYYAGDGLPQNIMLGLTYIVTAAEHGHSEAKRFMDAPILSQKEHLDHAKSGAATGDAQAQYDLAYRYEFGSGVEHDDSLALQWYQRAAEQGHSEAIFQTAMRFAKGVGTKPDDAQAMHWFQKAALKDRKRAAVAMTDMGRAFLAGEGVPRSKDVAHQWLARAAELDSIGAQLELAWMYAHGDGVQQSYEQAVRWYVKAAKLGSASAQYQLAAQYIKGQGVEADPETAYFWWLLSTKQKYIGGELNSEGYWDTLTPPQKERQQKLADQWKGDATGN